MINFDVEQSAVPEEHQLRPERLARLSAALDRRLRERPHGTVSVSFVSETEIRRLNRMYRKQDKVTDVLSFASPRGDMSGQLGDVLIAFEQAVRQAEDDDIDLEIVDLLVHGVLHILGFDHERPEDANLMFPLQDELVADIL